jgi:hypothetical protein
MGRSRGKDRKMNDSLSEEIIAYVEDEIDASEGLVSLADTAGTKPLEEYLESLKSKSKTTK